MPPISPSLWTHYADLGQPFDAPPSTLAAELRRATRGWGCDEDTLLAILLAAPASARRALPQDAQLWNQLLTISTPSALLAALEAP
jgi:hypothetical protein